jgi:uncharacterized membrane protein YhhN
MTTTTFLFIACLVGLGVALLGEYRRRVGWTLAGKLVAASAYLAVALDAGAWTSDWGRLLFIGMLFCWLGDLLLVATQRRSLFLAGLVSFLAGHVGYSFAFALRGITMEEMMLPAVLMGLFGLVVQRWLRPHLERPMVVPVHAYLAAILVMWFLATATHSAASSPYLLIGASLFVVSDLAVARNRFVVPAITNRLWGLPVYFCAQMLIALSAGQ